MHVYLLSRLPASILHTRSNSELERIDRNKCNIEINFSHVFSSILFYIAAILPLLILSFFNVVERLFILMSCVVSRLNVVVDTYLFT